METTQIPSKLLTPLHCTPHYHHPIHPQKSRQYLLWHYLNASEVTEVSKNFS